MELSGLPSDPNGVLDIVAEAMKKQQDLAQKMTRVSLELSLKEEKHQIANEALMDFYA